MPEEPNVEPRWSAEPAAPNPPDTHEPQHTPAPGGKGPLVLAPGQRPVTDYELLQRLGGGGFGEVWKAAGPGGIEVALKFVRLDARAGAFEQRALDVLKNIRHANLLDVYGAWQREGMLIFAMQLGDKTLYDRLHEVQKAGQVGIPLEELLDYLRDAARGLDHLNGLGIQHRDIKPHNLLLVGGSVRVSDFGLAKLLHNTVTSNTGALTVAYAAPEFFHGQTSTRSDQYSLAVTYCQLRGGRLPFEGPPTEIMAGHVMNPPDLAMLPEAERPAVGRALAKRPEGRWPSCRAFVEALAASQAAARGHTERAPLRPAIPPTTQGGASLPAVPGWQAGMPAPPSPRPAAPHGPIQPAGTRPPEGVIPTAELVVRSTQADHLDRHSPSGKRRLHPAAFLALGGVPILLLLALGAWWLFGKGPSGPGGPVATALLQKPADSARVAEGRPAEVEPKEDKQLAHAERKEETKPSDAKRQALPPARPAFTLSAVEALTLEPGESKTFEVQAQRADKTGLVAFSLQGLPAGVAQETLPTEAGSDRYRHRLTADYRMKDVTSQVTMLARAGEQSAEVRFRLAVKAYQNSLGMRFIRIPAGKFGMGSPDSDKDAYDIEKPQHAVEITRPFYLGQCEVTHGQFRRFVEAQRYQTEAEHSGRGGWGFDKATKKFKGYNPKYSWREVGFEQTDDHPVVNVTWNDAQKFCAWLNETEGRQYRLPTEAEWEYSCRAQTTTRYHSGEDAESLAGFANVADAAAKEVFAGWIAIKAKDGYVFTAPVGSFKPNGFGLSDMHGNVWEWCEDWYDEKYYAGSPSQNPPGPVAGSFRVVRGGSFDSSPRYVRAACRYRPEPTFRSYYIGFRVVCLR